MSPIKGLTEERRLPRIGKVRLGIKMKSPKGVEYPKATEYFVCTPEVQKVYGEKPKCLDIIIPVEEDEIWASQFYKQYSRSRGLVCKGDGVTCRRLVDEKTGGVAERDSAVTTWREGLPCEGRECPDYKAKKCQETMSLQFLLPKVPGLGIWQIDTGSIHSIMNINNCATLIRGICGKVNWIPLALTLEPTEVVNPEDNRKKTVYCMHLRTDFGLKEIMDAAAASRQALLVSPPTEDEAPLDKTVNGGNAENKEELDALIEEETETLFGEGIAIAKHAPPSPVTAPAGIQPIEPSKAPAASPTTQGSGTRDYAWIEQALPLTPWKESTAVSWISAQITPITDKKASLKDVFAGLNGEHQKKFTDKLNSLVEASGR